MLKNILLSKLYIHHETLIKSHDKVTLKMHTIYGETEEKSIVTMLLLIVKLIVF